MRRFLSALLLPLTFCAWIALFYRPENTYLNHSLLEIMGNSFALWRSWWQEHLGLSDFMVYSLPGGLWVYALSLLGWRLYLYGFHLFWLGLFFGLGFELTQFSELTDGTFDWYDLLAVLVGFGSARWCATYWLSVEWRSRPGIWRYVLFFSILFAAYGADVWKG